MSVSFRPSTPDDGPAIVALLRGAGLTPNSEERDLNWKYWRERADRPGSRSFVLTKGSEIVAHSGIVPGTCAWNGRRATIFHLTDWAASRTQVGAGVMLLRHLGGLADALMGVGGSRDTLRVRPMLGFRPWNTATGYVRTLHPLRRLAGEPHLSWRSLPRFARSMLWTFTAPSRQGDDWKWRKLTPAQVQTVDSVLPSANATTAVLERSTALFEYTLQCPMAAMALHSLEQADKIRGYFLLALVPGQARLVDCWVDSDQPSDWRALVLCAVNAAKQAPAIAELVTVASDPMLSSCLLQSGFHARWTAAVDVLASKEFGPPPTCLRFQMLDSDAAYYHPGNAEFWA
jgi:hypothetical protein